MAQFLYTILCMKKAWYIFIVAIFVSVAHLHAQHHQPHRTPEDIARKQTEMLVRELGIHDSIVKDTLFRMHLKFARKRVISNTRAEAMQYIQEMNNELKNILTPAQYQQFMNQQVNHAPHHPKPHHNRFTCSPMDSMSSQPNDSDQVANTPPPPPTSQR